jgi:hypothetical protein
MRIHHSRLPSGFAKLPNETLRDERLSIAARGHLAYLLCLPDGWNTTADAEYKRARSLRGKRGEGREAMRRIYAELKETGYIQYVKTQDNGTWSTEIHVFDRPHTDVRLTDTPETRMSVPPAEMPEPVDNWPDEFSQVAPMYGSPGVGTPAVGEPVHRSAVHSYEDGTTEDGEDESCGRVGDGVDDWGVRGNHPWHEDDGQGQGQDPSVAKSQNRRLPDGPEETSIDAYPPAAGTTAGSPQTARATRARPAALPRRCPNPQKPRLPTRPRDLGRRWVHDGAARSRSQPTRQPNRARTARRPSGLRR